VKIIGAIVVIILLVVGIAWIAPASILGWGIERATNGKIVLAETQGTVWDGSGILSVADEDKRYALTPEPMVWAVEKLPLLWGQVSGKLGFSNQRTLSAVSETASFRFSSGQMDIRRLSTPVTLSTLLRLVPGIDIFQFGGLLQLDIEQWAQLNDRMQVNASIVWRNARSALSQLDAIGSYEMRFSAANAPAVTMTLSTLTDPLHLDASGQWAVGGPFSIEGDAYAEPGSEAALQNLLIVAGPPRGGKHHFRFPK